MKKIEFFLNDYRIRLSSYISIWLIYLYFMLNNSLRGIDWLPFQEERVRNSVNHIINNSSFIKFGVTSWLPLNYTPEFKNTIYAVQAHEYIHYLALMKLNVFSQFASHVDKVVLFFLSSIVAEVCVRIFYKNSNLSKNVIGISSFLIFSTLPFVYRELLSSWQDIYCVLFIYLAFILFYSSKKRLGLIVLIYGLMWQYHWSILLGLFYLSTYIYNQLYFSKNKLTALFPPGFRSRKKSLIFVFAFFVSPLISAFQNILLNINGYELINNGALYRIGVDNYKNVHHGGLLAALQFLGGNRITLCIQPENFSSLNLGDLILPEIATNMNLSTVNLAQIFSFNCILAILSLASFSIISIFSYSLFAKSNPELRWILIPPAAAFFFWVFIFQQNNASHLQGYSMYFAPIFTIGILSLFHQFQWLNKKHLFSHIVFVIFISAIVITNIRVSFLTGVNG